MNNFSFTLSLIILALCLINSILLTGYAVSSLTFQPLLYVLLYAFIAYIATHMTEIIDGIFEFFNYGGKIES